jgi:hypothetical protein
MTATLCPHGVPHAELCRECYDERGDQLAALRDLVESLAEQRTRLACANAELARAYVDLISDDKPGAPCDHPLSASVPVSGSTTDRWCVRCGAIGCAERSGVGCTWRLPGRTP